MSPMQADGALDPSSGNSAFRLFFRSPLFFQRGRILLFLWFQREQGA
jgi:hypothetical protein